MSERRVYASDNNTEQIRMMELRIALELMQRTKAGQAQIFPSIVSSILQNVFVGIGGNQSTTEIEAQVGSMLRIYQICLISPSERTN
jgi:hypothetical protein